MNKATLLAGFFRYHREKLNYSQRGLINDSSPVKESSLCDFENGKRMLNEEQLTYLFKQIGYDYQAVLHSKTHEDEYHQIINAICDGNLDEAEDIYLSSVEDGVYNTLGTLLFSLVSYVIETVTKKNFNFENQLIFTCTHLLENDEKALLKMCEGKLAVANGVYEKAIVCYEDALNLTFDSKLRAMIFLNLGSTYSRCGDYYDAQRYTENALAIYSEELNFKRMIQANLTVGTICMLTNSFENAESSYRKAYNASLKLKDASKITTKCFNTLCWLYFKMNQYDKVKELLNNKPDDLVENKNTYFVLAWANYKLGNVDEAVRYCREGKETFPDHAYACTVYEYIERAVLGKKTGQDILLKKAITMEDYEHNKEIDELFTMELIDIYERRKNYEKAYKYARKLLNR